MDAKTDDKSGKCPFTGGTRGHVSTPERVQASAPEQK